MTRVRYVFLPSELTTNGSMSNDVRVTGACQRQSQRYRYIVSGGQSALTVAFWRKIGDFLNLKEQDARNIAKTVELVGLELGFPLETSQPVAFLPLLGLFRSLCRVITI